MSEEKKPMCLRDTIIPKSDQLNYDDVMAAPVTVVVTGMALGSEEQPVIVKIANDATGETMRDFKPCKTMRRVLIALWGDKGKDWMGKRMTLTGDSAVTFGKDRVGGIRVSHVSGIQDPQSLLVTVSKARRSTITVKPLPEKSQQ